MKAILAHFARNAARYLLGSMSLFFATLFSIMLGIETTKHGVVYIGAILTFPPSFYLLLFGQKRHGLLMDSGLALFFTTIHATLAMAAGVSLKVSYDHWGLTALLVIYGAGALVTMISMMKVLEMNKKRR